MEDDTAGVVERDDAPCGVEPLSTCHPAPVSLVVAEVALVGVLEGTPEEVWKLTCGHGGISEEAFFGYFAGRPRAFALALGGVSLLDPPRRLADYGLKAAPQSFAYVPAGVPAGVRGSA